jgi:hypothetical protein
MQIAACSALLHKMAVTAKNRKNRIILSGLLAFTGQTFCGILLA